MAKNPVPIAMVYLMLSRVVRGYMKGHTLKFPPVLGVATPGPVDMSALSLSSGGNDYVATREKRPLLISLIREGRRGKSSTHDLVYEAGVRGSVQMWKASLDVAIARREL